MIIPMYLRTSMLGRALVPKAIPELGTDLQQLLSPFVALCTGTLDS